MKRLLVVFTFMISFSFASYTISYKGISLGVINDFKTLDKNYLEADVTNFLAKLLLGKKKFVFYDENYTGFINDKNTKYRKDKYAIIYLLKKAFANDVKSERIEIKKNKFIDIKYNKNFNFTYNSKGKIKSKGYLKLTNGEFIKFVEEKNDIEISKIK